MSPSNPPEITLELSGGSLTIRASEATYHVVVAGSAGQAAALPVGKPQAALPPSQEEEAPPEAPADDWDELDLSAMEEETAPPAAPGAPEDEEYYRDLSNDMFLEVGRLARRLSMSIRDVKVDKIEAIDLESTGDQLENAKDELESVVKMTEQATLRIMDLGEEIQGAIDKARSLMEQMQVASGGEQAADDDSEQARQELGQALETISGYLSGLEGGPLNPLVEQAQALKQELDQAPQAQDAPAPAAPALRFEFPLELIFQTAYELCTNEAVKKHIKAMWDAGAKAFDNDKLAQSLNAIVTEEPDEDNFLNLSLKEVLKALFSSTKVENYKKILKKMAGTADQIFLDQFLPIEAMPASGGEAAAPAPEPAPADPAGPGPEFLAKLDELISSLEQAGESLAPPELPEDLAALLNKALSGGDGAGEALDPKTKEELENTMGVVFNSVNSIVEALSFQDLSGQAIYKIVRLLTDFQVQILAMLVSFGSKLKSKETDRGATVDTSEKTAQEEVGKMMNQLGMDEEQEDGDAASKLDQDSVNNLLESMGF